MPTAIVSRGQRFRVRTPLREAGAVSADSYPAIPSGRTATYTAAQAKILVPPFFDRFSPFSTVFSTSAESKFARKIKRSTVFRPLRGR